MSVKTDLTEQRGRLDERRKKLATVFEEAGDTIDLGQVKTLGDGLSNEEKAREVKKIHDEISDLGETVDSLAAIVKAAEDAERLTDPEQHRRKGEGEGGGPVHPASTEGQGAAIAKGQKTLGQMFVGSDAYKTKGKTAELTLPESVSGIKTTMTTSAGWAPETTRTGRLVEEAVRPIQVTDLLPMGRTSQSSVVYMEETTFTNNAAEVAEAGTYPEGALALTEQTSPVRKIAVFLPITDEQLEDVAQVESYVDNRLRFMVRQRLDGQILTGDGSSPNLEGINNVTGIQTQAKGADPVPDAIYKAMTLVRVTGRATPTGVIMHPNDWQDIRLLRTADGIYIWGSPADPGFDRIWGLPVALSDAQTENTAVVGDWATHSELVMRRDVDVQVSNSHSTYFVEGKQAIRADLRVALLFYRPAAFCTVTGI